jgi:hypothetical protein
VNAVVNTKIERVVEAFETMSVAVAVSIHSNPPNFKTPPVAAFDAVADARQEARDALAEFLKPTLRVVGDVNNLA